MDVYTVIFSSNPPMTHHRNPEHLRALGAWLRFVGYTIAALLAFILAAYAIHGAATWE
jgi:hypothetical protein